MKVFWSWQSDTPEKHNRFFVRDALKAALEQAAANLDLTEAERPELDHDTKGEPGLVSIVDTIFQKIAAAELFVGDVTFVGQTPADKKIPNPNVLIELGHAITSLGPSRILLVMNHAYGGKPEDLPFDLRHRRAPIAFTLHEDATASERKVAFDKLTRDLAAALTPSLGQVVQQRAATVEYPLHPARPGDRSTWLQEGQRIEHHDSGFNGGEKTWDVLEAPRFYLRMIPATHNRNIKRAQLENLPGGARLNAMDPWRDGDFGANDLGYIAVGIIPRMHATQVLAATQWFTETGEIWGFNGAASYETDGKYYIPDIAIAKSWQDFLRKCVTTMGALGEEGPYYVEVGVTELKKSRWLDRDRNSYGALASDMSLAQTDMVWAPNTQLSFLTQAYNKLAEVYNQPELTEAQFRSLR